MKTEHANRRPCIPDTRAPICILLMHLIGRIILKFGQFRSSWRTQKSLCVLKENSLKDPSWCSFISCSQVVVRDSRERYIVSLILQTSATGVPVTIDSFAFVRDQLQMSNKSSNIYKI